MLPSSYSSLTFSEVSTMSSDGAVGCSVGSEELSAPSFMLDTSEEDGPSSSSPADLQPAVDMESENKRTMHIKRII